MAIGTDTSNTGGVIEASRFPGSGCDAWETMTGITAESPLVGGHPGEPQYGHTGSWSHVSTAPNQAAAVAQGTAVQHWTGAFDFKNNPISWLMLAALLVWGWHTRAGGLLKKKR